MYAIIETGGKQIRVEEGAEIFVEKLPAEAGEAVEFDKVLLVSADELKVGKPYVEGAKVSGKVVKKNAGLNRNRKVSKVIALDVVHSYCGYHNSA